MALVSIALGGRAAYWRDRSRRDGFALCGLGIANACLCSSALQDGSIRRARRSRRRSRSATRASSSVRPDRLASGPNAASPALALRAGVCSPHVLERRALARRAVPNRFRGPDRNVRPSCLTSARESPRHRPGDGCLRVRNRPRKRTGASGPSATAGGRTPAGERPGAASEDDLRGRAGAHRRARAGCRRARGVVRRRRRPHRALCRAGARRRARRGRPAGRRLPRVRAQPASSRRSAATAAPTRRRCSGW